MKVSVSFVALCLVLVFSISSGNAFQGIKMCQRDCEETAGCKTIHYDPAHLECRLLFHWNKNVAATTTGVTQTVTKRNTVQDLLRKCNENQRLIYTKHNTPTCVPAAALGEELVKASLLLSNYDDTLLKVGFDTHSVEELCFPSWKIGCVAYWKREKRLLLGLDSEIISTPITIKKRTLVKRIRAENIFIDEEANLIFAKSSPGIGKRIYRMTLRGEQLICVIYMRDDATFLIDIDRKRKLIYGMTNFHLHTFTYNGTKSGRFDAKLETISPEGIVYDQGEDVIYFHDGSDSIYMYMHRNSTKIFATISFELDFTLLHSMVIHGKYLYITARHSNGNILRLDCTKQSKEQILKIPGTYRNPTNYETYKISLMLH